jgi:hypothetical protein
VKYFQPSFKPIGRHGGGEFTSATTNKQDYTPKVADKSCPAESFLKRQPYVYFCVI